MERGGFLESGATNTVAGKIWFNSYINSLNSEEKSKMQHHVGTNIYRFSDGNLVQAVENVDLPRAMGSKHVILNTNIVPSVIPLLLSRKSMKRAVMTIDFKNDQAIAFGEQIQLMNTKSGHYTILIRPYNTILNNIATGTNTAVVLKATNKTKTEIAQKVHRQFAHPLSDKLLKLLNSAGDPWKNDEKLKTLIKKISAECQIFQLYNRAPPRPIVGLPMATAFQECVLMDLKFYKGKILFHLIDHETRLSTSTFVPSKEPNVIINAIFRSWIQIFGAPEKFLTDNGGEFASAEFLEMCEAMNITVKVTAAEPPFSNGLVEKQNVIIADMMNKTLEESQIILDLALSWCMNAKNSLANVHGFSPFQLTLRQNLKLPSTFIDKPPALTPSNTSKILTGNLAALHKDRKAVVSCKHSERIQRALSNNIRTSGDTKYVSSNISKERMIRDGKDPGRF